MVEGFESNNVNWDNFVEDLPQLINNTTEAMIAELIDNSIEEDATKIELRITGNTNENLAITVYDNGKGFLTKENLKKSLDLSGRTKRKKIGKFNIGLKLSPLSRCGKVIIYSISQSKQLIHRYISKAEAKEATDYGSNPIEEESKLNTLIKKNIQEKGWTTAVTVTNFEKLPEFKDGLTLKSFSKYGEYLAEYFGIIYQNILLDKKNKGESIEIIIHGAKVFPKDPFWDRYTPDEILRRLDLPDTDKDSFTEDMKYTMECYVPFGTIKTPRIPVEIGDHKGKKHLIYVTGYSIPISQISAAFQKDADIRKEVFLSGPTGSAIRLKKPNVSGLYFYRNNRCVCFGNTGPDSNMGWYSLMGNVETNLNTTRIKIEFPDDLDEFFKLSPTKDRVSPPDTFFADILPSLNISITDQNLRGWMGEESRIFFQKNTSKKPGPKFSMSSANSYYGTGKTWTFKCDWCDHTHFKGGIECSKKPKTEVRDNITSGEEYIPTTSTEFDAPSTVTSDQTDNEIIPNKEEKSHWTIATSNKIVVILMRDDPNNLKILDEAREELNT